MDCPICGHDKMETKSIDERLSYEGQTLILHNMQGDFCGNCGEGIWDAKSYIRYTEAQAALLGAVKRTASAEIKRIRKKFKLTQRALAEAFGVGKIAFSRYERGETRPPAPVMKLLKLIEHHPELLAEIQADSTIVTNTRTPARTP